MCTLALTLALILALTLTSGVCVFVCACVFVASVSSSMRFKTGHVRDGEWENGKLKQWVTKQKLGALVIPKDLLETNLAADLAMLE